LYFAKIINYKITQPGVATVNVVNDANK